MLLIDGDQLPLIPLIEFTGKAAIVAPEHSGATCVKVGVPFGFEALVVIVKFKLEVLHPLIKE